MALDPFATGYAEALAASVGATVDDLAPEALAQSHLGRGRQDPAGGGSMNVSENLNKAADLIEPEGAWTRRELARNSRGFPVPVYDDTAVCWCASGALQRCLIAPDHSLDAETLTAALAALKRVTGLPTPMWNDAPARTQAEVVAALRKAAEAAS